MIPAISDISRTNQLKITSPLEDVAEKLYQYLFKSGKGIESFPAYSDKKTEDEKTDEDTVSENEDTHTFIEWHREIKHKIRDRLAKQGEDLKGAAPQYVMSKVDGKWQGFYLSPNKKYAGWKDAFVDKENVNYRQTILNLIFKAYLLSKLSPDFRPNQYMDKLLLIHSMKPTKSKDGLDVWGQILFLNYNQYQVVTLTVSRKNLLLSEKNPYRTFDGEEMRMLVYNDKNYYYSKKLDARSKNEINFMSFPKRTDKQPIETFKKTQLYYYQYLVTQLENFLKTCGIAYESLNFQADHYLQDRFIKHLKPVGALEIINNSGTDLTDTDKQVLEHVFHDFGGVSVLTFYQDGKTSSSYEQIEHEGKTCWEITENISWAEITLDTGKNYLVFNKILDKKTESSTAYQQEDGFWYPKKDIHNKKKVDFYSQLKRNYNYLNMGKFFSTQGVDIAEFKILPCKKMRSVLKRPKTEKEQKLGDTKRKTFLINEDVLYQDVQEFVGGKLLHADDLICAYLSGQQDEGERKKFYEKYRIKFSSEFQKIFIELRIKNWIRAAVLDSNVSFPITSPKLPEQQFFAIYVRHPKKQEEKAVAVEFFYKNGNLSIKSILCDVKEIKRRFRPILRTRKNTTEELLNGRHYLVDEKQADEKQKVSINCYTDNFFTPTLIGRETLIQDLESKNLKINRDRRNKLLPLVLSYNDTVNKVKDLICLDLHHKNENFIQYYVPLAGNLKAQLKDAEGFRVYHIIGQTFSGIALTTDELSKHPLTSLHFSTLTQNILKISDNSQSSLLQKVAKVFIEN